jgi:hypothetical protein
MATTAKLPWTYKQNTFQTSERLERKDRNHLTDYFIEYEASLRNNRRMFNPTYRREHLDYYGIVVFYTDQYKTTWQKV